MGSLLRAPYPPPLSEERLLALQADIQDWQLTHGSLIKMYTHNEDCAVLARPIGVSMFPTLFPKSCFSHALDLQESYNELYANIAEDESWLFDVLQDLILTDPFTRALWGVHEKVKEKGYIQPLTLGIFRSDYMLHSPEEPHEGESSPLASKTSGLAPEPTIKQVEFNTFSCAGGTHGNIVNAMHHHLARTGAYDLGTGSQNPITPSALPTTETITSITSGLAAAHIAYGPPRSAPATTTAILIAVQPNNINICDERPLEYSLWAHDPAIPTYRALFPSDITARTTLTQSRELLFYPPHATLPVEISAVYLRAAYDPAEHDSAGIAARTRLELARAIKCPSILAQLATFKKVQQALSLPGAVERFLPPPRAAQVRATFAPMYPLDDSEGGLRARALAADAGAAERFVLKPSLEGGGHNVYRGDIPRVLERVPEAEWRSYVLMELMRPPPLSNILLAGRGVYEGRVVSELGVFGVCMWRRRDGVTGTEIVENRQGGWSFKTKAEEVDEMSVIKGYGCFDTPCLV